MVFTYDWRALEPSSMRIRCTISSSRANRSVVRNEIWQTLFATNSAQRLIRSLACSHTCACTHTHIHIGILANRRRAATAFTLKIDDRERGRERRTVTEFINKKRKITKQIMIVCYFRFLAQCKITIFNCILVFRGMITKQSHRTPATNQFLITGKQDWWSAPKKNLIQVPNEIERNNKIIENASSWPNGPLYTYWVGIIRPITEGG